jgi:hypothetical protein
MTERIEEGFMAFVADGREGIGAVRGVTSTALVVYVENAGEFVVPLSAVTDVHSQNVILNPKLLDKAMLAAIGHAHDREDPSVAG